MTIVIDDYVELIAKASNRDLRVGDRGVVVEEYPTFVLVDWNDCVKRRIHRRRIMKVVPQHNAHVMAQHQHIYEESQRWTRRLRGEEGPPLNFDPDAVRAVIAALRGE